MNVPALHPKVRAIWFQQNTRADFANEGPLLKTSCHHFYGVGLRKSTAEVSFYCSDGSQLTFLCLDREIYCQRIAVFTTDDNAVFPLQTIYKKTNCVISCFLQMLPSPLLQCWTGLWKQISIFKKVYVSYFFQEPLLNRKLQLPDALCFQQGSFVILSVVLPGNKNNQNI